MNVKPSLLPLDENAVVDAVCATLMASGYEIQVKRTTSEQGIDVVAFHPDTQVQALVEAKGGTSSRKGSERFGKPYTQTQVFDRVAKGIYTCIRLRTEYPDRHAVRVILAVPDKPVHFQKYIDAVMSSLEAAGIEVWVAKEKLDEPTR